MAKKERFENYGNIIKEYNKLKINTINERNKLKENFNKLPKKEQNKLVKIKLIYYNNINNFIYIYLSK